MDIKLRLIRIRNLISLACSHSYPVRRGKGLGTSHIRAPISRYLFGRNSWWMRKCGWSLYILLMCFSLIVIQIYNNGFYIRRFKANGNKAVPEARLPPMMVGSFFFAGGLFIFGWTSSTRIFWLAPVIGLVCMGFGFFTIFQVHYHCPNPFAVTDDMSPVSIELSH
jgi:hypothetical protein